MEAWDPRGTMALPERLGIKENAAMTAHQERTDLVERED